MTFAPGLGQFMAGELSQHQAIQQLFSNRTWGNLPSHVLIEELPLESVDYKLVRHWGVPNIWVSLILFIIIRVSWREGGGVGGWSWGEKGGGVG